MKRPVGALALAAALVAGQAVAASAAVRIRDVGVDGYPLIGVTVSTDDPAPLTPANVRVLENGVEVSVESVTLLGSVTQEVDVVLAIDVSNSMRGPELATALAAAGSFIAEVPASLEVGVLAFARQPLVVAPLGRDREALAAAVNGMEAEREAGTALFDAVVAASGMFEGPGQHNLILLTDGRNTTGVAELEAAVASANAAGVTIFTIGLEGGERDDAVLEHLAASTGGAFTSLTPDDLGAAYRTLALEIGQQYVVTYRSKVPPGAPATVVVAAPGGSARMSLLMPPPAVRSTATSSGILAGVLEGDLGVAVVVGLVFLAAVNVIVLVRTIVHGRRRRRELEGRLIAGTGPATGTEDDQAARWVPRPLAQAAEWGAEAAHALGPVARRLERAGWKLHPGDFLAPALLTPLLVGAAVWLLVAPLWGVVAFLAILPVPFLILARAGDARIDALQGQLPDVLMVLASSLRAGHSFLQGLDGVAKEVEDPAASEFARALSEIQLGRTVDDALDALGARVQSLDLDWAVTAINIQRRVGGNLAEVLETVANTIRQRETIRRQIRVLSAEGRYSVYILTALPFLILGYLAVINPGYLDPLTGTPTGNMILIGASLLMVVGFVWMRKIVKLHV